MDPAAEASIICGANAAGPGGRTLASGHVSSGLIQDAVHAAAHRLSRLSADGEKVRERELARAVGDAIPSSVTEQKLHVPGWEPQPGNVDLVGSESPGDLRFAAELKLKAGNDLFECLWDMAKLLSLATTPDIGHVYVIAGTTERSWERPIECAEMFVTGRHELVGSIERLHDWWVKYILGNSTGRPTAVPSHVDVELIGAAKLALDDIPWELRAIQLTADSDDPTSWVPFESGLPVNRH